MSIYTVVFCGSTVSAMYRTPIDIETYSTRQGARDRVAAYFRNVGHDGWYVIEKGAEWTTDDGEGSVLLIASDVDEMSGIERE